jgi:hypothetical protein
MNIKIGYIKIAIGLVCSMLLFSCTKGDRPIPFPSGEVEVSLEKDVQPIFDQNCISCHPSSGGMSLKKGESHASLVNVISTEYGIVRVSPFHADSSVICFKLHGLEGYGFLMPLNGIPLEAEEIKTIEDWIDQGALDN